MEMYPHRSSRCPPNAAFGDSLWHSTDNDAGRVTRSAFGLDTGFFRSAVSHATAGYSSPEAPHLVATPPRCRCGGLSWRGRDETLLTGLPAWGWQAHRSGV